MRTISHSLSFIDSRTNTSRTVSQSLSFIDSRTDSSRTVLLNQLKAIFLSHIFLIWVWFFWPLIWHLGCANSPLFDHPEKTSMKVVEISRGWDQCRLRDRIKDNVAQKSCQYHCLKFRLKMSHNDLEPLLSCGSTSSGMLGAP